VYKKVLSFLCFLFFSFLFAIFFFNNRDVDTDLLNVDVAKPPASSSPKLDNFVSDESFVGSLKQEDIGMNDDARKSYLSD